jgi:tRNA (guanine37-N1)-methyltransferase
MEVPCVRVAREEGERARRELAASDLIDGDYEIVVEDGWLYLPVTDPAAVPDGQEVVIRDVAVRETQTLPADLLGFEPSYERLGDVAIVDEDDPERARAVADALMESDLPIRTVANKASEVKGERRVRDWEVLTGEAGGSAAGDASADAERESPEAGSGPRIETVHREYGCEFLLDLAEVYFSPRLATERHRVVEQVRAGERAFDMFAGVGPFAIPMAKRGAEVVAVDVNERAIEYLRENARSNDVEDRVTAIVGDVRDVVSGSSADGEGTADYERWADRIVMNLPHSADEFLATAVALAGEDCVLHFYDIQGDDDPFGPGERAIRAAAEPAGYDVDVETERVVRSYAPHESNVCLDVRLSRR